MTFSEPAKPYRKTAAGPDRRFGVTIAIFFAIVGLLPLYRGDVRWWAIALGALSLICAIIAPRQLRPLNILWFRLGLLIHRTVNPILMALLFFVGVAPTGLLARAFGKTFLHEGFDKAARTYWIHRESPAPRPGGMTKQF